LVLLLLLLLLLLLRKLLLLNQLRGLDEHVARRCMWPAGASADGQAWHHHAGDDARDGRCGIIMPVARRGLCRWAACPHADGPARGAESAVAAALEACRRWRAPALPASVLASVLASALEACRRQSAGAAAEESAGVESVSASEPRSCACAAVEG
jgi:hypothetical protein